MKKEIIKIGCFDYEIQYLDNIIIDGDSTYLGSIDYDSLIINIKKNIPEQVKEQTIFHEITHGILKYFELNKMNDNEKNVDLLSKGIYDFIKNNIEWINKNFN